ncbi:43866_t:CDS:2, partial [Gigaspora margarita]
INAIMLKCISVQQNSSAGITIGQIETGTTLNDSESVRINDVELLGKTTKMRLKQDQIRLGILDPIITNMAQLIKENIKSRNIGLHILQLVARLGFGFETDATTQNWQIAIPYLENCRTIKSILKTERVNYKRANIANSKNGGAEISFVSGKVKVPRKELGNVTNIIEKGKLKINKLDHLQVIGWKIEKKDIVENKIVRVVKKSAQREIRVNSLVVSLLEKYSRGTKKMNEAYTGASDTMDGKGSGTINFEYERLQDLVPRSERTKAPTEVRKKRRLDHKRASGGVVKKLKAVRTGSRNYPMMHYGFHAEAIV